MAVLRSLLFNVALVAWTLCYGVVALPMLFAPRATCTKVARFWNHVVLALLGFLVGLRYEVRGRDNLPARPCVLAIKHQSAFETLAFPLVVEDPIFVVKRELFVIPVFGWYLARLGMIGIDRRAGPKALMSIVRRAKVALERGHHVIIFPEGTRVAPYARRAYNPGVAALYAHVGGGDWASIVPHTWLRAMPVIGRTRALPLVDPEAGAACVLLTDRDFGPWAAEVWTPFTDAVLDELRETQP